MRLTACVSVVLVTLCLLFASSASLAQRDGKDRHDPVAKRSDIYCTGFISELPPRIELQVIGGEQENIKSTFSQGDIVFLNKGREGGVYPGAVYYVIRPLGEFKHPFTKKKLGYFVRELGILRVIETQDSTATAEIIVSCDTITFGDLLRTYEAYVAPEPREGQPLPRFGEGSGGTTGQIVLGSGYHEFLGANQIVHIDLGHRQGVQPGDYFTIFREVGASEGIVRYRDEKIGTNRSREFGSDRYRGGDFSIDAVRKPPDEVLGERPRIPRKVVGELIVLRVENTAAVALITRSVGEINIGDLIERSN